MNWPLALVWFLAGGAATIGFYVWAFRVALDDPTMRLRMFRILAKRWPESFEQACNDESILRPRLPHDTIPETIKFGTCRHCTLPWVLHEDGRLHEHPAFDERLSDQLCPGSGTRDFLEFE